MKIAISVICFISIIAVTTYLGEVCGRYVFHENYIGGIVCFAVSTGGIIRGVVDNIGKG